MAPKQAPPPFARDEKVLCFHHEMLYEAKILNVQSPSKNGDGSWHYKVHYKGWKATWDDWVPSDRIRKHNPENVELAAQLMAQVKSLTQKGGAKARKGKAAVAESARGSEERAGSAARGPRRTRDYELEQVSGASFFPAASLHFPPYRPSLLISLFSSQPSVFLSWSTPSPYCLLLRSLSPPFPHSFDFSLLSVFRDETEISQEASH